MDGQTPGVTTGNVEHGAATIRLPTDRFSRLRAMPGWTEANVRAARVLCIGAGALGNEIVKNLALVGIGWIYIVDPDRIETSNLTRSPLFRPSDVGRLKAEAAAMAAKSIWPGARVFYCVGRVGTDVGYGVFRRMSVVLGGVDNRLARRDIGRACYRFSAPYIDAGLDRLDGAVSHFLSPDEACYECTLGTTELDDLEAQYSCLGLAQPGVASDVGFAPTSPITSAIIAGLQCQAALKIIDGWPSTALPPSGSALRYGGATGSLVETNSFARRSCDTHLSGRIDPGDVMELGERSASSTTLAEILTVGRALTNADAYVDFARGRFDVHRDLVVTATCLQEGFCAESGAAEPLFRLRSTLTTLEQNCPGCGEPRLLDVVHAFRGDEWYANRSLAELGIPPLHLIPIFDPRSRRTLYLELTGDATRLFEASAAGTSPMSTDGQTDGAASQHDGQTGPLTWRSVPVQASAPNSWREVVP